MSVKNHITLYNRCLKHRLFDFAMSCMYIVNNYPMTKNKSIYHVKE